MCRPIRNLTQMRGFDTKDHVLTAFGGAGPQHACGVARKLGIEKVLVPRYGGVLSAYGLSLSDAMVARAMALCASMWIAVNCPHSLWK